MIECLAKALSFFFFNLSKHYLSKFPHGPVAKTSPSNNGGVGLIPGTGGSHMPRSATAIEPVL